MQSIWYMKCHTYSSVLPKRIYLYYQFSILRDYLFLITDTIPGVSTSRIWNINYKIVSKISLLTKSSFESEYILFCFRVGKCHENKNKIYKDASIGSGSTSFVE